MKKSFKFQSDSINTMVASLRTIALSTLNSNLILLILTKDVSSLKKDLDFKFQSDSINTHG